MSSWRLSVARGDNLRVGQPRPWIKVKDPEPCSNCGRPYTPLRRGRCQPCSLYFRKHGVERPLEYARPNRTCECGRTCV